MKNLKTPALERNCARAVVAIFYICLYTVAPGKVLIICRKFFSGVGSPLANALKLCGFKSRMNLTFFAVSASKCISLSIFYET